MAPESKTQELAKVSFKTSNLMEIGTLLENSSEKVLEDLLFEGFSRVPKKALNFSISS